MTEKYSLKRITHNRFFIRLMNPRHKQDRSGILAYLFPGIISTFLFFVAPLFFLIYVSFHEWDGLGEMTFIGIKNYSMLFADANFRRSLANTLSWIFVGVFIHIPLAMFFALILAKRPFGWKIFRTVFFLPNVISTTALALLWYFIFRPEFGLLNSMLKLLGLDSFTHPWLSLPDTALFGTQAPFILYIGFTMVIFLTQISTIPGEIYEAAQIDGATTWQMDRYITIPLVGKAVAINVIFVTAYCLRMFEYPFLMTDGGPANASMNLSLFIYKRMITAHAYGSSMAAALITLIIGALVMGAAFLAIRRFQENSIE